MWIFKTDRMGMPTKAVQRREAVVGAVDLNSHTGRADFGYNYLVWKAD